MNDTPKMWPAFFEGGDFVVDVQTQNHHGTLWSVIVVPTIHDLIYQHGNPYTFSDFVHARIFADLYSKTTNLSTRVNAYKECYIHFKSHHLDPDIWYLYKPAKGAFKDLQNAIEGCDDLIRTGHITEARISFTQDTKEAGCYYPQSQAGSVQVQFGEGADDGEGIQTDGDHPA